MAALHREVVSHHFFRRTARASAKRLNGKAVPKHSEAVDDASWPTPRVRVANSHFTVEKSKRGPYVWAVVRYTASE